VTIKEQIRNLPVIPPSFVANSKYEASRRVAHAKEFNMVLTSRQLPDGRYGLWRIA